MRLTKMVTENKIEKDCYNSSLEHCFGSVYSRIGAVITSDFIVFYCFDNIIYPSNS